jgi:pantoate--beta-alanine ligase
MEIFKTAKEMQQWSIEERKKGKTIAFVPTMGALHDGHLSLVREGKLRADRLVLSIYVNPTQFGPKEDFRRYPRETESDLRKAKELKTDAVFLPTDEEMYPKGYQTYVTVEGVTKYLCGVSRPGHFRGVATVVLKLLNIVMPHIALFGEKDYQQLVVIRRMVRDLNLPVEILGMPIVREADGLAMSSRNRYLSPNERKAALAISSALTKAEVLLASNQRNLNKILSAVYETIYAAKIVHIDYVSLCDPETLEELSSLKLPALLAIAAFVGPTRLIDNRILK